MSSVSPEISQVLTQMRLMQAQAQSESMRPQAEEQTSVSFGDLLTKSIDAVNETRQTSSALKTAYEMGDPNVSISEVMIASEKSGLAFDAMVQVRNKMIEAYKDIMSMPV